VLLACYAATVAAPELALRAPHGPRIFARDVARRRSQKAKRDKSWPGQGTNHDHNQARPRFAAPICASQAYSFLRERCLPRPPGGPWRASSHRPFDCCTAGASTRRPLLCAWLDRETFCHCQPPNRRNAPFRAISPFAGPHVRARRIFEDASKVSKVLKPPWKPPKYEARPTPVRGVGDLFPGRFFSPSHSISCSWPMDGQTSQHP
jgi:hypothetical protein